MDKIQISIFPDDEPQDIFDRLSFALLELGVRTERVDDEDDDVLTLELSKAELLDDDEEEED